MLFTYVSQKQQQKKQMEAYLKQEAEVKSVEQDDETSKQIEEVQRFEKAQTQCARQVMFVVLVDLTHYDQIPTHSLSSCLHVSRTRLSTQRTRAAPQIEESINTSVSSGFSSKSSKVRKPTTSLRHSDELLSSLCLYVG